MAYDQFRDGVRTLGKRDLPFDSWRYHYQNREFPDLARAASDTVMALNHFGTPLGVGPFSDNRVSMLINALKKMAAHFSESQKDAMFSGTATRIYGLD